MAIGLKLIDPFSVIDSRINAAISEEVNKRLIRNKGFIETQMSKMIQMWVRAQPEMLEIGLEKRLAGMLGIRKGLGPTAVDSIVMAVVAASSFRFSRFDKQMRGAAELNFQPTTFLNLLGLGTGHTKTKNGADLHWLDWLLMQGNKMIVVGYHYEPESGRGRSGLGAMDQGGAFRIPPEMAGVSTDNFITRAFSGKEKDIMNLFQRALVR